MDCSQNNTMESGDGRKKQSGRQGGISDPFYLSREDARGYENIASRELRRLRDRKGGNVYRTRVPGPY